MVSYSDVSPWAKTCVFFFFRALGRGVCCKPHNLPKQSPQKPGTPTWSVSLSELLDFGNQSIAWPFERQKMTQNRPFVHCLSSILHIIHSCTKQKKKHYFFLFFSLTSLFLLVWCSNLRSLPYLRGELTVWVSLHKALLYKPAFLKAGVRDTGGVPPHPATCSSVTWCCTARVARREATASPGSYRRSSWDGWMFQPGIW